MTVKDTINVVDGQGLPVDDIIVVANSEVRADQGAAGRVDFNAAIVDIPESGKYRIVAEAWFNSGDDQINESFYLQVRGPNGVVLPDDPNAYDRRVVADEPGEPHISSRDAGTFELEAGMNRIDLYHYAEISHIVPQFLYGPIDGPESIYILGFKLEHLGN